MNRRLTAGFALTSCSVRGWYWLLLLLLLSCVERTAPTPSSTADTQSEGAATPGTRPNMDSAEPNATTTQKPNSGTVAKSPYDICMEDCIKAQQKHPEESPNQCRHVCEGFEGE